jgi:hypothetical protein
MTRYLRRHALMGALAMLALCTLAAARHASPIYYAVLSVVGALQALIVRSLDRRLNA